ncbi:MAG: RNA polymerase factor sigma-54 [Candidatus Cloacimonetes bacterium]|nr:RNA polymerase factor sigma-54 [Candidatus Cloacimonadota bacterium]
MTRIRQTLSHKQTQNLLLKPKMLQSLEMLAMPLMELETHLKQEMITNPMLELKEQRDDEDETEEELSPDKETEPGETREDENEEKEPDETLDDTKELSEILDAYNEYHEENIYRYQQSERVNLEQLVRSQEDKKKEYLQQLDFYHLTDQEMDFAYELVDSTNDYGYLAEDFSISTLAEEYGLTAERGHEIRGIIMQLDPRGITARTIQECLIAQLEKTEENEPIIKLIAENFHDLIHKRYRQLTSQYGVCLNTVMSWKEQVSHLDPKPGLRLLGNQTEYIVPDVILKKIGNDYEIIINDFSFPNIRMSRYYRNILNLVKKDRQAVEYVRSKINSAKFLIKSIYLRARTLERVTRAIIRNQKEFFYENSGVLRPLTYSVIAEEIQVNESTISRVVRNKYIDTPFGVMCLKDFFSSRAGKDTNYESVSRQNVEILITKMIENEDIYNPLSDQDIADTLKLEGISVSRRVVAKYRKAKGILNSHLRKKVR